MIIIDEQPLQYINNVDITQSVLGDFAISFNVLNQDPLYPQVKEQAIIKVNNHEFIIKQIKEVGATKSIVAVSSFFEDTTKKQQEGIYGGTKPLKDFLDYAFKGTGWTYTTDLPNTRYLITNYGNDSAFNLIDLVCKTAKCEYVIQPNKNVHFSEMVGGDYDYQYRYGHNIAALEKSVDTTGLATKITGYGADGLKVTYTSPNAEKFGVIEVEPIRDERFHIKEELAKHIANQLQDEPEISITLDVVELLDRELGERVWLIYEPMDIVLKTRIMAKTSTLRNYDIVTTSVTIGNTQTKTITDQFAEQKVEYNEQNKVNRSRIEQTNDRITLEVEELELGISDTRALLEITASEIRTEVRKLEGEVEVGFSSMSQTINGFEIEVRGLSKEINSVSGEVDRLDTRVSIQAGEISSKVSRGDVISEINQSPERVTIKANRIDMEGITQLNGNVYLGRGGVNQSYVLNFGGSGVTLDADGGRLNISTPLGYTHFHHNIQVDERATFNGLTNITGTLNVYNQSAGSTGKVLTGPREMWVGFTSGRLRMSDGTTTYYFTPD